MSPDWVGKVARVDWVSYRSGDCRALVVLDVDGQCYCGLVGDRNRFEILAKGTESLQRRSCGALFHVPLEYCW